MPTSEFVCSINHEMAAAYQLIALNKLYLYRVQKDSSSFTFAHRYVVLGRIIFQLWLAPCVLCVVTNNELIFVSDLCASVRTFSSITSFVRML